MHVKTIMPTVQKLLLQVRKKWKMETLLEKRLFYKTGLWDDRMQFWQTPNFFPQKSESGKTVDRTSKESSKSCSSGQPICRYDNADKIMAIVPVYSLEVCKTEKKFFKDIVHLKMFLRPQRTEFWPHC